MHSRAINFFLLLVFSVVTGVRSEVSYFRSDGGVMHEDARLPCNFDMDAELLWCTELPPGHSTPCVIGDSIFVTTFDAQLKQLATVAIDRRTGAIRWQRIAPTDRIEPFHPIGSPASPTPASNGRQVFVFFGSYGMLCYSWDGNLLWERPFEQFQDEFGAASSPILVDDLVILNEDHDIDSYLIALDQKTGTVRWKTPRPDATRSYSTPVVLQRQDGRKEILVAGSLRLTAYNPKIGEPLWWYDGLSRIVDCTPVVHEGTVYIATWTPGGDADSRITMEPFPDALRTYDTDGDKHVSKAELSADSPVLDRFYRIDLNQDGKLNADEWQRHAVVFEKAVNVAVAILPGERGPLPSNYVRWTFDRGLPTVPSSVVYDGVLTMIKDSGIVTTLDIRDGRLLEQFRAEGRGNYYASLVAGDGKVYLASERGVVTILGSGRAGKVISAHDFGERIMATPVIKSGQLFIRTESALRCYVKAQTGQ